MKYPYQAARTLFLILLMVFSAFPMPTSILKGQRFCDGAEDNCLSSRQMGQWAETRADHFFVAENKITTPVTTDFAGKDLPCATWKTSDLEIISIDPKSYVTRGINPGLAIVTFKDYGANIAVLSHGSVIHIATHGVCAATSGGNSVLSIGMASTEIPLSNGGEASSAKPASNPSSSSSPRTEYQVSLTGEKKRRGPPKGNTNAKGNKGNMNAKGTKGNKGGRGAPVGNQYAFKPILPSEEMIAQYCHTPNVIVWIKEHAQILDEGAFLAEKEIQKREKREYEMRMRGPIQVFHQRERYFGWQAA